MRTSRKRSFLECLTGFSVARVVYTVQGSGCLKLGKVCSLIYCFVNFVSETELLLSWMIQTCSVVSVSFGNGCSMMHLACCREQFSERVFSSFTFLSHIFTPYSRQVFLEGNSLSLGSYVGGCHEFRTSQFTLVPGSGDGRLFDLVSTRSNGSRHGGDAWLDWLRPSWNEV